MGVFSANSFLIQKEKTILKHVCGQNTKHSISLFLNSALILFSKPKLNFYCFEY